MLSNLILIIKIYMHFETCQWSSVSSSITYRFEDFTYPELANKYNIIDYYRLMDDKKDLYQIVD